MKRLFDIFFSFFGLIAVAPAIAVFSLLIWLQDRRSPFYIAERIGKNFIPFRMIKLRSMVIHTNQAKVDSTGDDDPRITPLGKFVRQFKLDELPQLIHVLKGEMSFVGPRPNVIREVDIYTAEERHLLDVRPGITDFSSIVFSDLGTIIKDADDPNIAYNQLVRPWKSRLGLLYVEKQSFLVDLQLIFITIVAIANKTKALEMTGSLLRRLQADPMLIEVCARKSELKPYPPPGADSIVSSYRRPTS